ncbi:unnamed protein product, partial [Didymodactylos carnosus]
NFKELHFLKVSANDDKKFEFEATEIGQVMLLNEILKFISCESNFLGFVGYKLPIGLDIKESLGSGSSSYVLKCTYNNDVYASKISSNKLDEEYNIIKQLNSISNSSTINRLNAYYPETANNDYHVLLVKPVGGQLYTIDDLLRHVQSISAQLNLLHSINYVHRDIRTPNMILTQDFNDMLLIDYSSCAIIGKMSSYHGSLSTCSLPILKQLLATEPERNA